MVSSWTKLLAGLALAGQTFIAAAEPDCYYGEDEYTAGAILCQAEQRMQCKRDEEGRAVWASLNQHCTDPAIASAVPTRESDDNPSTAAAHGAVIAPKSGSGGGYLIEILWADYGRDGQSCDAAPAVKERCGGEAECDVAVRPNALCGDPFPGRPKLLSVYWRCTDESEFLPQPAAYGQDDSSIKLQCNL